MTGMNKSSISFHVLAGIVVIAVGIGAALWWSHAAPDTTYVKESLVASVDTVESLVDTPDKPLPQFIPVPESVRALYISSWVAGTSSIREPLLENILSHDINAVIIDIKDATGKISFRVRDPKLAAYGSDENRISDIDGLLQRLGEEGIYRIGRVSVFQDPFIVKAYPQWALTKKSDGGIWYDRKGLSFLDVTNRDVWDYTWAIAHEAHMRGFDEINFDYIRFPSDGAIADINYPVSGEAGRRESLKQFFAFIKEQSDTVPSLVTSADLFGMTTSHTDDLGIGQYWEDALPYFDYLAPMIYPSHYLKNFLGFKNPAEHPYEIITYALEHARIRTEALGYPVTVIRPWLQDFHLGSTYDASKITAQIRAANEQGITSWMMWSPSNRYTWDAYQKKSSMVE
jgi:hypothetical protein